MDTTHCFQHDLSNPPTSGADLDPVEALAEEFLERHRRGERVNLAEYVARYPELADRIRAFFPALCLVEKLKPALGAPGVGDPEAVRPLIADRLGEYRILREIGRGGMGVVYEAEQESLGRRVALKVLAAPGLKDPRRLLRFRREARAAARLHHTNIVPVFGVGESDGTHFYVMQFIPGLGLDAVLREVRRLRGAESCDLAATSAEGTPSPPAAHAAHSLVSGRFAATLAADSNPEAFEPASATGASTPSSPAVSLGESGWSSASECVGRYARSVALIGVQVAEALEYAHRLGTLHRDIKPSNLLLDGQGIAWITDFGLAKAADSDDLTHTGDVVGTVRYMAPERFEGRCDPQSDVYALGLTLYEMLALRPALDESDRGRLIRLVTQSEPPRLRKLEPTVPRDLETIVHKAVERDPGHRYASAGALAEDLRRFLDDRAIRARRLSRSEQAWRWCRRNPAEAALVSAVLAIVMLAVGGGLWVQGERAKRRAEAAIRESGAREAFIAMLDQAAVLRREGLWLEAGATLDQAERRLGDIRDRQPGALLQQARSDLDLAARLEKCRMDRAGHFWGKAGYKQAAGEYAAAFERAGIVPPGDNALATRIRASAIQEQLLAALDDWALVADDRVRTDVLRLARRVDSHPTWRDRVRDPSVRGDGPALKRLAAEALEMRDDDQPAQTLFNLGLLLKDAGGDPEALLRASQQRHPEDFWLNLALDNASPSIKPAESVGFFRAALVKRPRSATVWNNLGLALKNMGRLDEAEGAFRRAIALEPGAAAPHSNLCMILEGQDRLGEAMAAVRKAVELNPDGAPAHNNLGRLLERLGRFDEAMAAYRKAMALDPSAALPCDNLGRLLITRRRIAELADIMQRLAETAPDNHEACYHDAILRAQGADRVAYRRRCRQLLERFGETIDPVIAERTAKACLLVPLTGPGQDEACALADRAVGMSRGRWVLPWAEVAQELADYRRGRFAEAVATADRALSFRRPEEWNRELPAHLVRAMALYRLGRHVEARTALQTASELYRTRAANVVGSVVGGDWYDRTIGEVLGREADALILDTTFPADPFAF